MKKTLKIFLMIFIITTIISCDYGPKATLNEDFAIVDNSTELPFSKLVGEYQLDKNSKKRYGINDSVTLEFKIRRDSSFTATNYVNYKTRILEIKKYNGVLQYTNDYNDKPPFSDLRVNNEKFNGGGNIDVYYRKKDSVIALYIFTPFVPATKENNMQYKEGDYLRYIKVK